MDDRVMAVSVAEAARRLGISPRTMATLLAENKVRSATAGRRRLIPILALEEFLAQDAPKRMTRQPKKRKAVTHE